MIQEIKEAICLEAEGDKNLLSYKLKDAKNAYHLAAESWVKASNIEKEDQNRCLYMAALLFYKSENYKKTTEIINNFNFTKIPNSLAMELKEIYNQSNVKNNSNYNKKTLESLGSYLKQLDKKDKKIAIKVLDLLKDHPYLIPTKQSLEIRIGCLKILNREEEIKIFEQDLEDFHKLEH